MKRKRFLSLLLCLCLLTGLLGVSAQAAETTLTLREDWRLTEDLDLDVPKGTTLIIDGQGQYHIYELGGMLLNSNAGTVQFKDGTILYPAGSQTACTTATSNQLMAQRQPRVTITADYLSLTGGGAVTFTVALSPAGSGEITVQCTSHTGIAVTGSGTAWSATLPNTAGEYVFTAQAEGYVDGTITVSVIASTTPGGDGGDSGSSGGSGGSSSGSTTTTETASDGTVTKITKNPDGSSQVQVKAPDGSTSTTTVDASGKSATQATLSQTAVTAAAEAGQAAALPMPAITVTDDRASAPTVTVTLPGSGSTQVLIPAEKVTAGTVAVLVKADGSEEVIKTSLTTEAGVTVTLSSGDTVKLVDNAKAFTDVSVSYWGSDAIAFATSRELFSGTGERVFAPESAMTRAMLLTVLARYDGVDTSTGATWYEAAVSWAVEASISDGTALEQSITREQLATILWRYAGQPSPSGTLSGYSDADAVSDWAGQAMAWAVETGLINGMGGDTLAPQGSATRAQVATILMRFITNENG